MRLFIAEKPEMALATPLLSFPSNILRQRTNSQAREAEKYALVEV